MTNVTDAPLVICEVVLDVELPPQPLIVMAPTKTSKARHPAIQSAPVVTFLRNQKNGSNRNGNKISEVVVEVNVSVKTTVIAYVLFGVTDEVTILRMPEE